MKYIIIYSDGCYEKAGRGTGFPTTEKDEAKVFDSEDDAHEYCAWLIEAKVIPLK
jgi:hypothetical protein